MIVAGMSPCISRQVCCTLRDSTTTRGTNSSSPCKARRSARGWTGVSSARPRMRRLPPEAWRSGFCPAVWCIRWRSRSCPCNEGSRHPTDGSFECKRAGRHRNPPRRRRKEDIILHSTNLRRPSLPVRQWQLHVAGGRTQAEQLGGHLAVIKSAEENDWAWKRSPTSSRHNLPIKSGRVAGGWVPRRRLPRSLGNGSRASLCSFPSGDGKSPAHRSIRPASSGWRTPTTMTASPTGLPRMDPIAAAF